jgi:hypothetical protein
MNNIEKFFDYCLKIFIVLSPALFVPSPPGMQPIETIEFGYMSQELFFRYGIIFLFGITMMMRPVRILKFNSGFAFLAIAIVFSLFIDFNIQVRRQLLNLFFGLLFYKIVVEYIQLNKLKEYAGWFFWFLFANLMLCLFQNIGYDPIFRHIHSNLVPTTENIVGFMRLRANLGVITAMVAPILILLSPWTLIVTLPLLFYAKSSAAVLAVLSSLGVIFSQRVPKKIFVLVLAGLLALGIFYVLKMDMPNGDFGKRPEIWFRTAHEVLTKSPFVGFGLGSFAKWMPSMDQIGVSDKLFWIWVHNDYLQVLFTNGIVGLVVILCFVKTRIREFLRLRENHEIQVLFGCFLSVAIISFFHFPFEMAKLAGIAVFMMALFHAKVIDQTSEVIA